MDRKDTVQELKRLGQSLWVDVGYLSSLEMDRLQRWVDEGSVRGIVSTALLPLETHNHWLLTHPDLRLLAHAGEARDEMPIALLVDEIRKRADFLLPMFEETNGDDGFISVELDPHVYTDPQALLETTMLVWGLVNRPNLLVTIPASEQTMQVIGQAIENGVNVNAAMIFSLEQYLRVVETYLGSLEARLRQGSGIEHIVCVASFSLSRIDKHVDKILESYKGEGGEARRATALVGHVGLATAKLAYAQAKVSFGDERFGRLAEEGARVQRILWSELGGPFDQTDLDRAGELVGPETIIAPTLHDIEAFLNLEKVDMTLEQGLSEARGQLQALDSLGIMMDELSEEIFRAVINERITAHEQLQAAIVKQAQVYKRELGQIQEHYQTALEQLNKEEISQRIWQADASLWSKDRKTAKRISRKMGWLDLPLHARDLIKECSQYASVLREKGLDTMVVFCSGSTASFIQALKDRSELPAETLRIVDLSNVKTAHQVIYALDVQHAQFVYISLPDHKDQWDPVLDQCRDSLRAAGGTNLADQFTLIAHTDVVDKLISGRDSFGASFSVPQELPSHFSALSYPGMIVAAWLGFDLEAIVAGLDGMMRSCLPVEPVWRNPGLSLAAAITSAGTAGFSPVALIADEEWAASSIWVEDLLHEANLSGRGDLSVSQIMTLNEISSDFKKSLVIYFHTEGRYPPQIEEMDSSGIPIKILNLLAKPETIGGLVGLWYFSIAAMGHLYGINPFERA